jgi:cbb3-type cytochrome oxidase subunit 3
MHKTVPILSQSKEKIPWLAYLLLVLQCVVWWLLSAFRQKVEGEVSQSSYCVIKA